VVEQDGRQALLRPGDLTFVDLSRPVHWTMSVPQDTRRRALRRRVDAFIEQRLGDPALSPRSIAAAHHVSVRHLYKLFESEQTSVAGWIRLRDRPVSAIAARWGLTNAAHSAVRSGPPTGSRPSSTA
jgi:AraC-like DNA-binding protein